MANLIKNTKLTRCVNATAAGTSSVNGTHVDMQGFDGVMFVLGVGTLTSTQVTSLKAQAGAISDDSDMADISNAATGNFADADGNKLAVLDVFRPQKRYVRPVVVRGTANAVIDFVIAIQYQTDKKPTVHDTSTVSQTALLAN